MDTLRATYKDDDDENSSKNTDNDISETLTPAAVPGTTAATPDTSIDPTSDIKEEPLGSEDLSDFENHQEIGKDEAKGSPNFAKISEEGEDEEEIPPAKRQKQLSSFASEAETEEVVLVTTPPRPISKTIRTTIASTSTTVAKKSKKKSNANNVWTKPTSRKGKKKLKNNSKTTPDVQKEDLVRITPMPRLPDKNDDNPDMKICLSRTFKAEKVELSEDRLSAGSCKGYRMVRATRGVMEGAWYFEIKVVKLGETGHTRLGWSTDKGDLQAPVGYDGNSFGYRDIDGSKINKALREKYGEEGYAEGDVIGFYINLPEGDLYAPKPPRLVWFKGQRYACAPDAKEDPPKIIPGSEVSFFKNGICQGVAFTDINGGRYYPAASMYTLPNQPNCMVTFNFGPDFESFPADFGGRPLPKPMSEVPYHGSDIITETGKPWVSTRMCSMLKLVEEQDNKNMED